MLPLQVWQAGKGNFGQGRVWRRSAAEAQQAGMNSALLHPIFLLPFCPGRLACAAGGSWAGAQLTSDGTASGPSHAGPQPRCQGGNRGDAGTGDLTEESEDHDGCCLCFTLLPMQLNSSRLHAAAALYAKQLFLTRRSFCSELPLWCLSLCSCMPASLLSYRLFPYEPR